MIDILTFTAAFGAGGFGCGVVLAVDAAVKRKALRSKLRTLAANLAFVAGDRDACAAQLAKAKIRAHALDRENQTLAKALVRAKQERDAAHDEIARRRELARTAAMKGRCSQAATRREKAA